MIELVLGKNLYVHKYATIICGNEHLQNLHIRVTVDMFDLGLGTSFLQTILN